jgi:hypothetical protein
MLASQFDRIIEMGLGAQTAGSYEGMRTCRSKKEAGNAVLLIACMPWYF